MSSILDGIARAAETVGQAGSKVANAAAGATTNAVNSALQTTTAAVDALSGKAADKTVEQLTSAVTIIARRLDQQGINQGEVSASLNFMGINIGITIPISSLMEVEKTKRENMLRNIE